MKTPIALALVALIASPCSAQVDAATEQRVQEATAQFFGHLSADAYADQYAMMSPRLSQQISFPRWQALRQDLATAIGGTPTAFVPHRSTFYERDRPLVAIDYSAAAPNPDQYLCGYVLWEIGPDDGIAFTRIEQNLVDSAVFRSVPKNEAAQVMADWHCPVPLIETVLNIKIQ